MGSYWRVRARGIAFVFKMDVDEPSLLHIFVRHLTEETDVFDVFFDPAASETWNDVHQRFERRTSTHGLYYFWLDSQRKTVMVITCFTTEGGSS